MLRDGEPLTRLSSQTKSSTIPVQLPARNQVVDTEPFPLAVAPRIQDKSLHPRRALPPALGRLPKRFVRPCMGNAPALSSFYADSFSREMAGFRDVINARSR